MGLDTARLLPAEEASAPLIAALVRRTVEEVYPRYYCREIVDAFRALHTPEALPGIIEALLQEGYTFVPISELILPGEYGVDYTIDHTGRQCPA